MIFKTKAKTENKKIIKEKIVFENKHEKTNVIKLKKEGKNQAPKNKVTIVKAEKIIEIYSPKK